MTDDRRSGGASPRGGVPTAVVSLAAVVAFGWVLALAAPVGAGLHRVATAIQQGSTAPAPLPAAPTVDGVVGAVYLLVAVGVVGHLVRERSPHVPDPDERLF